MTDVCELQKFQLKKGCQCFFNIIEKSHDLAKAESDHNLSSHTLIGDYPTRCKSVHKMVTHILEQIYGYSTGIKLPGVSYCSLQYCIMQLYIFRNQFANNEQ